MHELSIGGWVGIWAQKLADFVASLLTIVGALPGAPGAFAETARHVLAGPGGGRDTSANFLLLTICVALVFAPGALVRSRPATAWFASRLAPALGVILADGLDMVGALLVATLSAAFVFPGAEPFDQFAVALLWGVARWCISMRGTVIFLRPGRSDLRLIPVDDDAARRAVLLAGLAYAIGLGFVTIVPVFLNNGLPLLNARAFALTLGTLDAVVALAAVRRLSDGLIDGRRWLPRVGLAVVVCLWAIWVTSVIALDFTLYDAFTKTLIIAWIIIGLYGLSGLAVRPRPVGSDVSDDSAVDQRTLVGPALRRGLLAVSAAFGLSLVVHDWIVDVFERVSPDDWPTLAGAANLALAVAVIGYLCFEALRTWSAVRFGPERAALTPGQDDSDDNHHSGSRLATILPVFSRILLVASIGLAILLGLANYGVNIAPILAGAGIFGLAISFGSQALVRDIVSGFFFIVDDAFRVGEYIDTGRHKGTVERISLRSFRLRHQNGQVHTVPYGQIAAVTNYSRDWATVKFNLRLSRSIDIEAVRKIAKRAGQSMLEDPDLGLEFIVPLKLQGVVDIQETAVILRFKFTVRPVRASLVQREAIKRLYLAFKDAGIDFAINSMVVHRGDGRPITPSAGAGQEAAAP